MFRTAHLILGLTVISLGLASSANAQGLLISSDAEHAHRLPRIMPRPTPGQPGFLYDIAKLEIDASIRDQVAEVQVGQTFKNRTNRVLQVKFVFPLPYDGAVDQMTFMVDGEELEGRLLEADKAREIYHRMFVGVRTRHWFSGLGPECFKRKSFRCQPEPSEPCRCATRNSAAEAGR